MALVVFLYLYLAICRNGSRYGGAPARTIPNCLPACLPARLPLNGRRVCLLPNGLPACLPPAYYTVCPLPLRA